MAEERFARARNHLVDRLVEAGVTDARVVDALRRVRRHEFVPPEHLDEAYDNHPLPIGEGQTISQPYIVGKMSELAGVGAGARVLEIGTGSGYQAAVLAELAGEVYTIEIVESLGRAARATLDRLGYDNIRYRLGDGYAGWPEAAPFDAIVVTAAPSEVPQPLVDQLAVGGRLVIPVGDIHQELRVLERTPDGVRTRSVFGVRFVPMTGRAASDG